MKLIALLIVVFLIASITWSQTKEDLLNIEGETIQVNTLDRNGLKPIDEVCPVENIKVNDEVTYVVYNYLVIGFCCEDCSEVFLKSPKVYEKKLKQKDS